MSVQETVLAQLRRKHPGLAQASTKSPAKAIRLFCLDCMGGSPGEVASCESESCPLHPFRMGVGFRRDLTEEQRAHLSERARRATAARVSRGHQDDVDLGARAAGDRPGGGREGQTLLSGGAAQGPAPGPEPGR